MNKKHVIPSAPTVKTVAEPSGQKELKLNKKVQNRRPFAHIIAENDA